MRRAADDPVAREKMHNASCIAGMAFTNAFLGLNHSMAHKLGGEYHIPHGLANALLLPYVIYYNAQKPTKFATFPKYETFIADQKYAKAARMLGLGGKTTQESVLNLVHAIQELMKKVGLPMSIKDCGVDEQEFLLKLDAPRITLIPTSAPWPIPVIRWCRKSRRSIAKPITARKSNKAPSTGPAVPKARRIHGFSGLFPLSPVLSPAPQRFSIPPVLPPSRESRLWDLAPLTENTPPDSGDSLPACPRHAVTPRRERTSSPPSPSKPAVWRKWRIPMLN